MNQKAKSQHRITLVLKAPRQKKQEQEFPKKGKDTLDDILKTVYGALRKLFDSKDKKPESAPTIGIRG